jgi:hypothetical protein
MVPVEVLGPNVVEQYKHRRSVAVLELERLELGTALMCWTTHDTDRGVVVRRKRRRGGDAVEARLVIWVSSSDVSESETASEPETTSEPETASETEMAASSLGSSLSIVFSNVAWSNLLPALYFCHTMRLNHQYISLAVN